MVQKIETIDFQEFQTFAAVVRHGGITAAGTALGISKSTVSLQISRLEQRLETRLFERNSRRVALTREGEQVLPRVLSLLAEAEHLLEEAKTATTKPRGIVRIAVTPPLGGAVMERLVPMVRDKFPDVSLVVASSYDLDDLKDPSFDFAIRVGRVRDDTLVADKVGCFFRILVCAPSHPAAQFKSLDMLRGTDILTYSSRTTDVDWRLERKRGAQVATLDYQAIVASQDFDLLLRLARLGLGVAAVPDFMARSDLANGNLMEVLPDWRSPSIDVMLAFRVGVSRVSRVAAVLQEARRAVAAVLSEGAAEKQKPKPCAASVFG